MFYSLLATLGGDTRAPRTHGPLRSYIRSWCGRTVDGNTEMRCRGRQPYLVTLKDQRSKEEIGPARLVVLLGCQRRRWLCRRCRPQLHLRPALTLWFCGMRITQRHIGGGCHLLQGYLRHRQHLRPRPSGLAERRRQRRCAACPHSCSARGDGGSARHASFHHQNRTNNGPRRAAGARSM